MKKVYSIVRIMRIMDQEKFDRYVAGHVPTIAKFGGKFLVKGKTAEILEGIPERGRVVIHEFPGIEQFKNWYYSEDYRPWKELRQSCADVNVMLVEGE